MPIEVNHKNHKVIRQSGGPPGPAGPQGPAGGVGPTGPQGPPGDDGFSLRNQPNGLAGLESDSKIQLSQIPGLPGEAIITGTINDMFLPATLTGKLMADMEIDAAGAINVSSRLMDWVNVKNYGAIGDNIVDDTAAITAAVTALGSNGGILFFPRGIYRYTQIVVNNLANVRFKGLGGPASGGTRGSVLWCTVTGSAGGINAQSTNGFHMEDMVLGHTGSFTGTLLDLSSASNTSYFSIRRNLFKGANTAQGVYLNRAQDGIIEGNHFQQGAPYNILGMSQSGVGFGFANGIHISNNAFHVSTTGNTLAHIGGVGGGWEISGGNVFEDVGTNGAIWNSDAITSALCSGVSITGNWLGDVQGSPAAYSVVLTGTGITVQGNYFGWQGVEIRGTSSGVHINANHIQTNGVGGILVSGTLTEWDFTNNEWFGSDKTKWVLPVGTALKQTGVPVAGPTWLIHNPNTSSGEGRSTIGFSSSRVSAKVYEVGIDAGGGTTKDFNIYDVSLAVNRWGINSAGSVLSGRQASLATTATDGFTYFRTMSGTPTGVPSTVTGMLPLAFDSANGIPYFYNNSVWRAFTMNTATQTLTGKTLTSPVINTPTGIVKGDVGLGNVDNTSDATKNSASVTLTNKTLTTPVIGDFTSAQHNHSSAATGGVLDAYNPAVVPGPMWNSTAIAATMDPAINTAGQTLTTGNMFLSRVYLLAGQTVTSLNTFCTAKGTTVTDSYLALYDGSGNRLGVSGDLSAFSATAVMTGTLGSPVVISTTGYYYFALVVQFTGGTTSFYGVAPNASWNAVGTAGTTRRGFSVVLASGVPPTSITMSASAANRVFNIVAL